MIAEMYLYDSTIANLYLLQYNVLDMIRFWREIGQNSVFLILWKT